MLWTVSFCDGADIEFRLTPVAPMQVVPLLKPVDKCWQPADFLPPSEDPDFLEKVGAIRVSAPPERVRVTRLPAAVSLIGGTSSYVMLYSVRTGARASRAR